MSLDAAWSHAELAHALCDALVAKGHLKEKPAFIREDREAKIAGIFETIGLDGAKMASLDNVGPLEMMIRKGTNQETWVPQVVDALIKMLPEEVATAKKKMGMDEGAKEELQAAKQKTEKLQARLEQQREEAGKGRQRNGDEEDSGGEDGNGRRGGGKGYNRGFGDRDFGDRDKGGSRGFGNRDFGDDGDRGKGRSKGDRPPRDQSDTLCYNCQGMGHTSRDCPEPPKPKGAGKGRKPRSEMQCNNCRGFGHKSRDCPEPVDEEALAARLAAKRAADGDD